MNLSRNLISLLAAALVLGSPALASDLEQALESAGANRPQLEHAISSVPEGAEREAMSWLIEHMPAGDLKSLSAEYLLANHRSAFESWRTAPWKAKVSDELFEDAVLPYASVNERRDAWRKSLRERCLPMIEGAETASQAAAMLNNAIWKEFNVKYSTQREKPDQSPFETMESGLASCTGLSVLLVDSCRSVGIPARFVGTALWSDDSGNHSWVEIWDDGWHYTGAAEATGMKLDKGWFAGRAAGAKREDPRYAIYATSWRSTPAWFPMVWLPEDKSVNAVNVTDRYTQAAQEVPAGQVRVRFRAFEAGSGARVAAEVWLRGTGDLDPQAEFLGVDAGKTRDESFDSNDHLVVLLDAGKKYFCRFDWQGERRIFDFVAKDEQLISVGSSEGRPWEAQALSKAGAERQVALEWKAFAETTRKRWSEELASGVFEYGTLKMPFWYTTYGDKPANGHSLYISMHGGGGAPKEVNDQQWENQKKLYTPSEGIYLAPRAPTDAWNLWHQGHIDVMFDALIRRLIVVEDVDPDRIYLTGYSAGGDGVYQLAPRMADRFAAAAMMAGHPNETKPDGLRNLPFALHVGANDDAYDRNKIAGQWKLKLAALAVADPGGYIHEVELHEGKGHWMDREDAKALPWMAQFTRNLRPKRIVWLQDDVLHRRFYWLRNLDPKARERMVVEREGQTITIVEAPAGAQLEILLDDSMCDLDQPVIVRQGETELYRGMAPRTLSHIQQALEERHDPRGMFCSRISVTLPE